MPISSNTCKHRVWSNVLNSVLWYSQNPILLYFHFFFCYIFHFISFISISFIMNEKGNFSCLRAINISLSISYLYCLSHWIVGLLLLICRFLYIKEIIYLGLDLWILFPVCFLSFIILMAYVCLCVCNCFWKCSVCFKNALTSKSRLYLLFKKSEGKKLYY